MAQNPYDMLLNQASPELLANMPLPIIVALLARFYDQLVQDETTSAAATHVEHAIDILMTTLTERHSGECH